MSRFPLALVAVAFAVLAAFFGIARTSTTSAKAALAAAAARTEHSPGVRVVVRASVRPPHRQPRRFGGSGVMDAHGGRLHLHLEQIGGGVVDEVFVHSGPRLTVYLKQAGGMHWVKFDASAREEARFGADVSVIAGADEDPAQPLRLLQSSTVQHVRKVGPHHYRATVNMLDAARKAGTTRAGLRRLHREIGSPLQRIDAWVVDGRLRREVVQMQTMTLSTTYTTLRGPAEWSTPPASNTAEIPA